MRNFGIVAFVLGVLLFIYAGDQEKGYESVPAGETAFESLDYPAGRWQMARYGGAALAGLGVLMAMFPKGR
jgi:hypothetical protein